MGWGPELSAETRVRIFELHDIGWSLQKSTLLRIQQYKLLSHEYESEHEYMEHKYLYYNKEHHVLLQKMSGIQL